MSNIPDITTLSDLLTTSPTQNSRKEVLSRSEAVKTGVKDDNSESPEDGESNSKQNIDDLFEPEEGTNDDNDNASKDGGPGRREKGSDGPRSSRSNEFEELLDREGYKLELANERSELLKQRTKLKNEIEEKHSVLRRLQKEKTEEWMNAKLKKFLDDNDNEFLGQEGALIDTNDDDDILQNLHVLPSSDWVKRLQYVNRFLPFLELDNLKTFNAYEQDGLLMRYIQFKILCPLVFRVKVQISVDTSDDSVKGFEVLDPDSMLAVRLISQPFAALITEYLTSKKVSLFIYGLNSLCAEIHKRVEAMSHIIKKYYDIVQKDRFPGLFDRQNLPTRLEIYSKLKTINSVVFNVEGGTLNLVWDLTQGTKSLGECNSDINLFISSQNKVMELKGMFDLLITKNGVEKAFDIMLNDYLTSKSLTK